MRINSIKIIVAAIIVVLASNLLSGCDNASDQSAAERLETAQALKKTVNLYLVAVEDKANDAVVRIVLDNPEREPITSVQAWLAYNPDVLKGLLINTDDSAFDLAAPYDNDFDEAAGLVMIGRSTGRAVKDAKILVAEVHFERLADGAAMIEAYDYRQDLTGHTSANIMRDGTPVNVLLKPQSPLPIVKQ